MFGRLLLAFILFSCSSCYSQEDMGLIKNWRSYPVPVNQDSLLKYNWTITGQAVYLKDGEIHVGEEKDRMGAKDLPFKVNVNKEDRITVGKVSCLKVDDGLIIGFNHGEWGGSLYWFSPEGEKHYKISNDQVIQFIRRDGRNYAIQGLSHMTFSEGSIITIDKKNGKWQANTYFKLPDAPNVITTDSAGDFYVITSSRILKVDKDGKATTLLEDGFWSYGLYPNSVVIKENILYAGMRGGVLKYDIKNNKQTWLMKH